jgi:hypothetical protein
LFDILFHIFSSNNNVYFMTAANLLKYMSANLLVVNPDKTQFLIAGGEKGGGPIRVGIALIERSDEIVLLGMKVK